MFFRCLLSIVCRSHRLYVHQHFSQAQSFPVSQKSRSLYQDDGNTLGLLGLELHIRLKHTVEDKRQCCYKPSELLTSILFLSSHTRTHAWYTLGHPLEVALGQMDTILLCLDTHVLTKSAADIDYVKMQWFNLIQKCAIGLSGTCKKD